MMKGADSHSRAGAERRGGQASGGRGQTRAADSGPAAAEGATGRREAYRPVLDWLFASLANTENYRSRRNAFALFCTRL